MIEAQGTRVVLTKQKKENTTSSGIILTESTDEEYYTVVSVGSEAKLSATANDTVIVSGSLNTGTMKKLTVKHIDYYIVDASSVLVKVEL